MKTGKRMAAAAVCLIWVPMVVAGEQSTGLDRARQLGGIYAIGKEGCGVPEAQLAAFKRQADKELGGDKGLVAAYEQSLAEISKSIRADKAWLGSPRRDRDCVPTRLLFATALFKG